ncbi:hypothetical protein A2814_03335 [Candidatus Nomurabacteria bacterium RIFCSPHIGHO2_01_FULL_38_19]|uniref:Uncharacterized protein n=1 Tax=Candidatus Nomurabacteria bacterium RIFCSPHIGHO2_01_FULL_38_19 TaxID=1801732 RepID=A0A1F6UQ95_9BACT|nr:MAG: hypothetical protein A2814_03335 [Candidatus Nomurabacteria bacterium RIFCSPHIGHO2_01_FULL_38_19]
MVPNKTILAFWGSRKVIADISIRRKPLKINQKEPTSSIIPNKDALDAPEKMAERKETRTMPAPASRHIDLGKLILPSDNRAIIQKIIDTISPIIKNRPFPVSIEILVKGKKKIGNNTTTKKSDEKEILSIIFEYMSFIILH